MATRWRILAGALLAAGLVTVALSQPGQVAALQPTCDLFNSPVQVDTAAELGACIDAYNQASGPGQTFQIALGAVVEIDGALPVINNSTTNPPTLLLRGSGKFDALTTFLVSRSGHLLEQQAGHLRIEGISALSQASTFHIRGGSFTLVRSSVIFSDTAVQVGPEATVRVENSSIAGNRIGVLVDDGGLLTLESSTVVNQREGGVVANQGAASIQGSLIAANLGGDCVGNSFAIGLGNIFSDATCSGIATPSVVGTFDECTVACGRVVEIFADSPAIDAYPECGAGLVDQRGFARPVGACDAGSFERLDLCQWLAVTIDMNLNGGDGTGTPGDDVIMGTPGADLINGGAGNDTVCAGAGDDVVRGGPGDDTLWGEDGADRLYGAQGHDVIDGGRDADTIHGNRGNDHLSGGRGDDRIYGYAGDDEIFGNAGHDSLHGNRGADFIQGGFDDDVIYGYAGDDTLQGSVGDDVVRGHFGNDIATGGDGADHVVGSAGDDVVGGGNGNDIVEGNSGNDVVRGGWGNDALDGGIGFDSCDGVDGTDSAARCEVTTNLG